MIEKLRPFLQAILDGKELEFFIYGNAQERFWTTCKESDQLNLLSTLVDTDRVRLKKPTITINGIQLVPPETTAPAIRSTYYTFDLCTKNITTAMYWDNDIADHQMLERGLVFLTNEDALAMANCILAQLRPNKD